MNTLFNQYQALKAEQPTIRAVDAALKLNTTEAQLVAAQVGTNAIKLDINHIESILKGLKKLEHVMAMTRNELVINEIKGCYEKLYTSERNEQKMAIAINPGGIDLRLFLYKWASVFAVKLNNMVSIQCFDKYGQAVHKIFSTEQTNLAAYEALINKYSDCEQSNVLAIEPKIVQALTFKPQENIDVADFLNAWENLQDVHHFPALLTKFDVCRTQALEIAQPHWAQEILPISLPYIFETLKKQQNEVMIFVNNDAAVQIYSGTLNNLKQVGPWYNVLDEGFNLHVRSDDFARAFVVKKPTDNGDVVVHSIEFFDSLGNTVLTLFGRRTEGNKQSNKWITLCEQLWQQRLVA
ncbi:ChuX/HutX family heme-like substrate-binding protein [Pseudoalteromonas sp. S558]|uniref:hemin-degrading factor n=1 Tax=Pseudoalteromonas sp. S558 TaxID=2066515 RepID=UPI00110BA3D7|nr:ChuX/HutX family heme-like substrate-binding protein [Pseudoalteromonas sp. S558]TMO02947.1 hemin-degrading factor [Pseudoalteromonas sp. S558]